MKVLLLVLIVFFIVGYNYLKNIANRRRTTVSAVFRQMIDQLLNGEDAQPFNQQGNRVQINQPGQRPSVPRNFKALIGGVVILFVVISGFMSFYTIGPEEKGVVTRFGKFIKTTDPGPHLKIPWADSVTKVQTERIHQVEFGFRTKNASAGRTEYSKGNYTSESKMVTGDLNVVETEWVVQFKISNPYHYLYKTSDPIENIKDVSEAVMRRLVGDMLVSDVLTTGRTEIASKAKVISQKIFDSYEQGIKIVNVQPQDINPPESVKDSFNDVNNAKQEQDKLINQAEQAYNSVVPEARGKADADVQGARGSALARINRAKGDADKFNKMLAEYKKSPSITKKRMYLETMQRILKNRKVILVEPQAQKGIYPIYDLNKKGGK